MPQILGVDFSGAEPESGKTWLTQGVLDGNLLTLREPRRVRRLELTEILAACLDHTVAALDFPFATPRAFAEFWLPECQEMPELWEESAQWEYCDFWTLRNEFVGVHREPKRACDPPESYSCLHMVNPNMLPMTFRGMQLLHRLWAGPTNNPVSVPPLPNLSRPGAGPITELLEVMPGAVLRRLGLPFKGYKGGQQALELRR